MSAKDSPLSSQQHAGVEGGGLTPIALDPRPGIRKFIAILSSTGPISEEDQDRAVSILSAMLEGVMQQCNSNFALLDSAMRELAVLRTDWNEHRPLIEEVNLDMRTMAQDITAVEDAVRGLEESFGDILSATPTEELKRVRESHQILRRDINQLQDGINRYSDRLADQLTGMQQRIASLQQAQRIYAMPGPQMWEPPTYASTVRSTAPPAGAPSPRPGESERDEEMVDCGDNHRNGIVPDTEKSFLTKPLDLAGYGQWGGDILKENFETCVEQLRTGLSTNRVENFGEMAKLGVMHTKWCANEETKQQFSQFRTAGVCTVDGMIQRFREHYLVNEFATRTLDAALNRMRFKAGVKVEEHFTQLKTLLDNSGITTESDRWLRLAHTLPEYVQAELIKELPHPPLRTLSNAKEVVRRLQTCASVQAGKFTQRPVWVNDVPSSAASIPRFPPPPPPGKTQGGGQGGGKGKEDEDIAWYDPKTGQLRCYMCRKFGHARKDCPEKGKSPAKAPKKGQGKAWKRSPKKNGTGPNPETAHSQEKDRPSKRPKLEHAPCAKCGAANHREDACLCVQDIGVLESDSEDLLRD